MAYWGVGLPILRESLLFFVLYWAVFLLALFCAIFFAMLDLRYIRLQHAAAERKLYIELLGDEEFRKSLRKGMEEANRKQQL